MAEMKTNATKAALVAATKAAEQDMKGQEDVDMEEVEYYTCTTHTHTFDFSSVGRCRMNVE